MECRYCFSFVIATLLRVLCFEPVTCSVLRQSGNYTIAALLPIHTSVEKNPKTCSKQLDFKRVIEAQAIIYAVNKVNSDQGLLAGATLGYDIEDICQDIPESLLKVVDELLARNETMRPPVALLLDLSEIFTHLIASYKTRDIPLLSLGPVPGGSRESNVFYLDPGQSRLSNALLKLIQQLNWAVMDVLVENEDDYKLFKESIKPLKICLKNIIHNKQNTTEKNKDSLLVLSNTFQILKQSPSNFFRGRKIMFAGDYLDVSENISKIGLAGPLALQKKQENLSKFKEHLWDSAWNNETWIGKVLRGSLQFQDCTVSGDIESCMSQIVKNLLSELSYAGKVIDAVYTVANGLKNSQSKRLTGVDILQMPEFTSPTGNTISFTANRDLTNVDYSVYNLHEKPALLVGTVRTSSKPRETTVNLIKDTLEWNEQSNLSCSTSCPKGVTPVPFPGRLSKCCVTCSNLTMQCGKGKRLSKDGKQCITVKLDYLRWHHPVSLMIMIMVAIFFCLLVCLFNLYVKKSHTTTIQTSKLATIPLLLSLFITLIVALIPILKPSTAACNAYTFGFVHGLGIPLCILISRSNSFYKRFHKEDGSLRKKMCYGDPQNIIAVVLILITLILCIVFLAVFPAHVVYYPTDNPEVNYIECSMFSGGEFLFPFFFTIFLTIIFSVKHSSAGTQEEDIYESHFVAISIFGFFFLSFLNVIFVYGVHGKVKVMLVCIIALLHFINFVVFIFLPKCYVIVFKRDPTRFSPFPLTSGFEGELLISDKEDEPTS